jgi:hypothetical protein
MIIIRWNAAKRIQKNFRYFRNKRLGIVTENKYSNMKAQRANTHQQQVYQTRVDSAEVIISFLRILGKQCKNMILKYAR